MKKRFYIFIAALCLALPAKAEVFVEGLEDVPIADGMKQIPNDSISFGNEESRLVEAMLTSTRVGFKKVEQFYTNTLPHMGWVYQGKRDKTLVFEREQEVLEIACESEKPLMVRLTAKSKL